MDDITICARYARNSSTHQKETSIEDQLRNCRDYAESRDWKAPDEYIFFDRAISGTSIAPRESFKKLMSIATSGKCPFNKILIDSTSRMARNTREALNIFSLLTYYGIHVYYVAQGIDTSDETAEEMIIVQGLVDSLYIKNLARDTHRGIKGQVLKGFSGGGRRYGFRSEPVFNGKVDIYGMPDAEGYKLKIFAEEAENLLRAHRLFGEEGYSGMKIVNLFNKELIETGKPRPPKGEYWSLSTLMGSPKMGRGILSNPIYNGRYYWNRLKKLQHPETGKKRFLLRDKDEWVLFINPEMKIVDDTLWEKVQKRRRHIEETTKGRYTQGKLSYSTNLLAGLLKCSCCGGNVVIVSGGKYPKYGCSTHWNKGASVCSSESKIRKRELEEAIIASLCLDFCSEASIFHATAKANTFLSGKVTNTPQWEKNAFENQLHQIEKEICNYIKAIQFGIISGVVQEKLAEAERKKNDLLVKLEEINKAQTSLQSVISFQQVEQHLRNIRETLSLHPTLGKEFLQKIIARVNVDASGGFWKASIVCRKDGFLCGSTIIANSADHFPIEGTVAA